MSEKTQLWTEEDLLQWTVTWMCDLKNTMANWKYHKGAYTMYCFLKIVSYIYMYVEYVDTQKNKHDDPVNFTKD